MLGVFFCKLSKSFRTFFWCAQGLTIGIYAACVHMPNFNGVHMILDMHTFRRMLSFSKIFKFSKSFWFLWFYIVYCLLLYIWLLIYLSLEEIASLLFTFVLRNFIFPYKLFLNVLYVFIIKLWKSHTCT